MLSKTPSKPSALSLFQGETRHKRLVPFEQSFAYKLFLIDIDIDRLDEASAQSACFAVERTSLFSFRRRDHGSRKEIPLRPWAEEMFALADINLDGGSIRLVTIPRHLFYKFAPISLWFGYQPDGELCGIIYEVNNTFGETHAYVAPVNSERAQHEAEKQLYVSPFFDVTGKYRFTLRTPDERLSLIIENIENGERTHVATLKAKRHPAKVSTLLKAAFLRPFSTLGVSAAIHFEALKLWVRKANYRSRPASPPSPASRATPLPLGGKGQQNDK